MGVYFLGCFNFICFFVRIVVYIRIFRIRVYRCCFKGFIYDFVFFNIVKVKCGRVLFYVEEEFEG